MKRSRKLDRVFSRATVSVAVLAFAAWLTSAQLLQAQSSNGAQSSQDVAEAARQARAKKQQASGTHHVYTNEDLRRKKILTPEDESRAMAAKQKQEPVAPTMDPSVQAETLDATSQTPQEPLGDIARRLQNAKKISPFHLPVNQPQFAAPKISVAIPAMQPEVLPQPDPPAMEFAPVRPHAPATHVMMPAAPFFPAAAARGHRVDPFVGRRTQPIAPVVAVTPPVRTVKPVAPLAIAPSAIAPIAVTPATPVAPALVAPMSKSSAPVAAASQIVVQAGDTLWTLSRQHLGRGTRWLELMVANPHVAEATRLVPGTVLTLPAPSAAKRSEAAGQTVTVQLGDTLTKLAAVAYGNAAHWRCIAEANPTLKNPNRIEVGQILSLPKSCRR